MASSRLGSLLLRQPIAKHLCSELAAHAVQPQYHVFWNVNGILAQLLLCRARKRASAPQKCVKRVLPSQKSIMPLGAYTCMISIQCGSRRSGIRCMQDTSERRRAEVHTPANCPTSHTLSSCPSIQDRTPTSTSCCQLPHAWLPTALGTEQASAALCRR